MTNIDIVRENQMRLQVIALSENAGGTLRQETTRGTQCKAILVMRTVIARINHPRKLLHRVKYAISGQCSQDTACRDILDLIERGASCSSPGRPVKSSSQAG
jgi:hypothetical protein